MDTKKDVICFQDLWSIAVGQSALQDANLIEKELISAVDSLKQGLKYYKDYGGSSQLKSSKNVSDNLYTFLSKASKLLNVDGLQLLAIYENFTQSYFRGSKEKLNRMLTEEKSHTLLLSELTNYYFVERLYLLRTLGQIISFFQDKTHKYKDVYQNVMKQLSDVILTLENQYENSLKAKPPAMSLRKLHKNGEAEISTRLALQRVKEQCEILELIFLHYAQYGMKSNKLYSLAKLYKDYGFGSEHPYIDYIAPELVTPLINSMNALQQLIIIEGFDMDLLKEPEDHYLLKNKKNIDKIDSIVTSLIDQQQLAPLVLSWATVRYLLLDEHGGPATQKMGEKAVSYKVWQQMMNLLSNYPFNNKSHVAATAKKVIREVLSRVTTTFHEDTLGDYSDLVSLAVYVLTDTLDAGMDNNGLDTLLLSAAGFFPLYVDPMLSLLSCMINTKEDAMQAHAFISSLPIFSEYIATCTRDEVESIEDASVWRLLASKPIRSAGGLHTVRLPVGTIGNLVDSQYGAMVQWRRRVDGWKVFRAELKSLIEYQGPNSNLELLGYLQKTELIYHLVETILIPAKDFPRQDTASLAVLETMDVFVSNMHRIIQRVSQSPSPPLSLIMRCVRCSTAWIRINPIQNAPNILSQFSQIHFLPSSEQIRFTLAVFGQESQPGLYGVLLLKFERTNGCYIVTVATIELLMALLEYAFENDASTIEELSSSVEYILNEVFACYQQWPKNHLESWDNIGVRCMEMSHQILSTSVDHLNPTREAVLRLQKNVIDILSCSSVAKVILQLSCVDVVTLHAVMANEPSSLAVHRISETIKLGFSLLNNLLRIESSLIPSDELEERSYLHRALATPAADNINLVSVVASYVYHRHNIALPRLALVLLRRISLIAPMSLYACLGPDVDAIRDILLHRLKSTSEDISLKVAILEFFVATVQTQPGLLELFLDLELIEKEKPETNLRLGKSSCLNVVLDMINLKNQGTYRLPPKLHCACVKLLNALWVDKRHSALQAIRSSSTNDGLGFWSSVLYPLFSENSPQDIAQSELLEICAHIFNVIAHECFLTSKTDRDEALVKVLDEFNNKNRYEHWSKVLLCVAKTLVSAPKSERRRHQMFASAWRSFLITNDVKDGKLFHKIIDDLCSAIEFLVEEVNSDPDVIVVIDLLSSLLVIIFYDQIKAGQHMELTMEMQPFLRRIVSCVESVYESERHIRIFTHLQAAAILIIESSPYNSPEFPGSFKPAADLTEVSCKQLNVFLREFDGKKFDKLEISLLLIRSLETLFKIGDRFVQQSWLKIVSREATLHLLVSVVVKCITACRNSNDMIRLTVAIFRLLLTIAPHPQCARKILDTGMLSEVYLSLTNLYTPDTKKKWIEVYHLTLVLLSRMIGSLSYDFMSDSLDFIGVHHERLFQCLCALRWTPTSTVLQEAVLTTAFLSAVSRDFLHQWRFKLQRSYEDALAHILSTTHLIVAMLLQPRLLLKSTKLGDKKEITPTKTSSLKLLSSKRSLSKTQDEDISNPQISNIQEQLYFIMGNCIDFLINVSPNLCQIMLDQGIDPDEYSQLLSINFSTPSLDQEPIASFGVIICAANLALSALHKMDTNEEKNSAFHNALTVMAESALVLVMSQCLLLLKQSNISNRQKQLLKRELSDELNSCVRSASRHLRHSSSSFSPHSSPIQSHSGLVTPSKGSGVSGSKGILELVSAFNKQLMS